MSNLVYCSVIRGPYPCQLKIRYTEKTKTLNLNFCLFLGKGQRGRITDHGRQITVKRKRFYEIGSHHWSYRSSVLFFLSNLFIKYFKNCCKSILCNNLNLSFNLPSPCKHTYICYTSIVYNKNIYKTKD